MKKHESTPAESVAVSVKLEKIRGPIPKMRRSPLMGRITAKERKALRRTCYHEGGHYIALRSFGVHGIVEIRPNNGEGDKKVFGCVQILGRLTPWQLSVMCWAGPLAEAFFEDREKDPWQAIVPGGDPVYLLRDPDWLEGDGKYSAWDYASDIDRQGIMGHPREHRTFLAAARVLIKWIKNVEYFIARLYRMTPAAELRPARIGKRSQS